jgi:hypothetical protein
MTIQTGEHQDDIARILREVGLHDCSVELVESVQQWATSVGVEEKNPDRVAMAGTADGKPLIVLKSEITEDDRAGICGRMMVGGFDEELNRIESSEVFLEHLILHEAAHLLLPSGADEDECDRWAFANLASRISRRTA